MTDMKKAKPIESCVHRLLQSGTKKKLALVVMLLALASSVWLVTSELVKVKLLPNQFSDQFTIYVDLPEGSSVYETKEVTGCVLRQFKQEDAVTDMSVFYGESAPVDFSAMIKGRLFEEGDHVANIMVNLKKEDEREENSVDLVHRLRKVIQNHCTLNGAHFQFVQPPAGPPYLADIVLEVAGDAPYEKLEHLAYRIEPFFKAREGVVDVDVLTDANVTRYNLRLDKEKILKSGLQIEQVKKILYIAFEGMDIAYENDARTPNQIPIHVVLQDKDKTLRKADGKTLLHKLSEVNLLNAQGMQIPLSELVTVERTLKGHTISSKNLMPLVNVAGNTDGISQIYALLDIRDRIMEKFDGEYEIKKIGLLDLELASKQSGEVFHLHWDGEQKVSWDTVTDLSMALGVAMVVIFFMMVLYYKSFSLAAGIILASFISIVGVIYMHWFWDMASTMPFYMTGTSLIGFIALIGINSRNSLLIIDFAKQLIEEKGMDVDRAIAVAVNTRAKPILLTVLAIVFASMLLTLDPVFGGLGVALIGGTLAAYAVSLFIVPIFIQGPLHKEYRERAVKGEN